MEKLKGAAANTGTALLKAGTTVIDATASLFNSGKVKRQEQEIAELKRENYELEMKTRTSKATCGQQTPKPKGNGKLHTGRSEPEKQG